MRSKMGYLNDRYTFNTALAGNASDELFKAALTALMLMLQPEALQKESDVFKAVHTTRGVEPAPCLQQDACRARRACHRTHICSPHLLMPTRRHARRRI